MAQMPPLNAPHTAVLLLADGTFFFGYGIGKSGETLGELCFNTAMTGYQEILTDPSYSGQIITFTAPHIGNVGTNDQDVEAVTPVVNGLIVREAITEPSNFRNTLHLQAWLEQHEITGISGIDTRALTRHIRKNGAQNAAIMFPAEGETFDAEAMAEKLANRTSLAGKELASEVSVHTAYENTETLWELGEGYGALGKPKYHVVAIDYGVKQNILRCLGEIGCKVTILPAESTAAAIMKYKPDGIFLSNGPGDPAATADYALPVIKELCKGDVPIFGICLGHQLLASALGARTEKMHQGHRGANHPIKRVSTGEVEITSQNHGFVVCHSSVPDTLKVTHVSLFDGTVAGIHHKEKPFFSVQYHPEASPGPHDAFYLFEAFAALMDARKTQKKAA